MTSEKFEDIARRRIFLVQKFRVDFDEKIFRSVAFGESLFGALQYLFFLAFDVHADKINFLELKEIVECHDLNFDFFIFHAHVFSLDKAR